MYGGDDAPLAGPGLNVKELTQDVKLIRVVVIDGEDHNAAAIKEGVEQLKAELAKDWVSIVAVPADNVFIYARSDASGEKLAGAALLVADGNNVVIGNLVGHVPLGKLAKIAAQLGKGASKISWNSSPRVWVVADVRRSKESSKASRVA